MDSPVNVYVDHHHFSAYVEERDEIHRYLSRLRLF